MPANLPVTCLHFNSVRYENLILPFLVLLTLPVWGQIQLDNQFEDWGGIPHITDTEGGPFVAPVTSNAEWLYLHIEMVEEVALDEDVLPNDFRILLDLRRRPQHRRGLREPRTRR